MTTLMTMGACMGPWRNGSDAGDDCAKAGNTADVTWHYEPGLKLLSVRHIFGGHFCSSSEKGL